MLGRISLPMQLVGVVLIALLFGGYVSTYTAEALYTFSLVFKEILGFFLPFIIFSFIFAGILSFKKAAPLVIGILITLIIISNICVSFGAFTIGKFFLPSLLGGNSVDGLINNSPIQPLFQFSFPPLVGSEKAMLSAIVLGLLFSFIYIPFVERTAGFIKSTVEMILNALFIPLLPLYVLGFLVKLVQEGTFLSLFGSYGKAFILILCVQLLVATLWYFIAAKGSPSLMLTYMKNSFASYLTAFSTMSSVAAIPVTLKTVKQNIGDQPIANIAIPISANVHLMGDAVTVPIFSLVTLAMFTGTIPSYATFFTFVLYFCMAMLATSGVPGGGIIMVIPILKSILGFNAEMISIMTALYLLQDSFGTGGNVYGDGAITIIAHNVLTKLGIAEK